MRPSVTVFDTDPRSVHAIRTALQDMALVAAASFDPACAIDCDRYTNSSMAIVAARSLGEDNWKTVAALAASGMRVIVVGDGGSAEDARGALRAGAKAFIVSTDAKALQSAVRNLADGKRAVPPSGWRSWRPWRLSSSATSG